MNDLNGMTVATYKAGENLAGTYVDPKSDVESVYIQSPPSFADTKINPRPVVIIFSAGAITAEDVRIEAIKAIAEEQKLFAVCPASFNEDTLIDTVEWLRNNAKTLNLVAKDIRVGYEAGCENAAEAFRAMASDEFDAEFKDAGEFGVSSGV